MLVRRVGAFLEDWPEVVNLLLLVLVAGHWRAATRWESFPNPLASIASAENILDLYLGILAFSSLLAGFAGIVVVFAMAPESESLRRLRELGGSRLAANWVSPVTCSITGAVGAVGASVTLLAGHPKVAAWVIEATMLVILHGLVRMLWLLRSLINIVSKEDASTSSQAPTPTVDVGSIPAVRDLGDSASKL